VNQAVSLNSIEPGINMVTTNLFARTNPATVDQNAETFAGAKPTCMSAFRVCYQTIIGFPQTPTPLPHAPRIEA
jgi:hypothetical protein